MARNLVTGAVAGCAVCTFGASSVHADITLHFDLPGTPLGVFGLQYTADYLSQVSDIADGVITETRFHLEFNTTVAPNPFQNAADLAIAFQPPAGDLPIFTLTGADLGWSGTGTFIADFQTSALNLPILDFPPDAEFALWFVSIFSNNSSSPLLGGQLTNSYIEVDVVTIPSPGAAALVMLGCLGRRRRTRD